MVILFFVLRETVLEYTTPELRAFGAIPPTAFGSGPLPFTTPRAVTVLEWYTPKPCVLQKTFGGRQLVVPYVTTYGGLEGARQALENAFYLVVLVVAPGTYVQVHLRCIAQ